jgi:PAS domain-containing protein
MPTSTFLVSDAVYRTLVESAPDGIVIAGQEGRIVVVNAQTEKLFGYDRSELLNKPIEFLIPERFRGKHRGHRAGFMSSPQLHADELFRGLLDSAPDAMVVVGAQGQIVLINSQTEKLFGHKLGANRSRC